MYRNVMLDEVEFERRRKQVLAGWPTGAGVDIDEAVAYHKSLAPEMRAVQVINRAIQEGRSLISPRAGVAPFRFHKSLVRTLAEAGADLAPSSIDSYTRHSRYEEIEKALEIGEREDRITLNGYPVVNYGVKVTRELVESISVPINIRATAQHPLAMEISLAGGIAYLDTTTLHTGIAYRRSKPVAEMIADTQYIARLVGEYEMRGAPIWVFCRTGYTGTMVPPSIQLATAVFEALIQAGQGVKNYSVCCSQAWNVAQDLAVLKVGPKITREYLDRFGFGDVNVCTELSVYTAAFPPDRARAFGIIGLGAVVAALGNATIVMVKSPEEGLALPSPEANTDAIRATKQVLDWLKNQTLLEDPAVNEEATYLEREVRSIVDRIIELGDGDIVLGMPRAFEAGVIDIPFAPNVCNAGRMIPVRDNRGAIRILDPGNLPLDGEVMEFHREKIAERERATGRKADYEMLIQDVLSVVAEGRMGGS